MNLIEMTDADRAELVLLQSLGRQSTLPLSGETLPAILDWGLTIAASGEPLPPLGVVADIGHLAFATRLEQEPAATRCPAPAGWPVGLTRLYEDYVLGKLYGDSSFERGAAALARYQPAQRSRGLAHLVAAIQRRAGFGGWALAPAVLKTISQRPIDDVLAAVWRAQEGPACEEISSLYEELAAAVRQSAAALSANDLFELEHQAALMQYAERLELRQALQAASLLRAEIPPRAPRKRVETAQVATQLVDESSYPVGGFSSISTRGSIESLLHSQLAFMEREERPDMFDIKFLRDELLYYSRDENQFFRRRRTFILALLPSLVHARVQDATLPCQRLVMALAACTVTIRQLLEWLTEESLAFQVWFVDGAEKTLMAEKRLLELLFREQIENGAISLCMGSLADLRTSAVKAARRSQCQTLLLSSEPVGKPSAPMSTEPAEKTPFVSGRETSADRLNTPHQFLVGERAALSGPEEETPPEDAASPLEAWQRAVRQWLEAWI